MELAVRELWRLVRPGGKLAITTWGPRFFEPASTAFWDSIRAVRPDLYKTFNPWDQLTDPESLSQLMTEAGVENVEVVAEAGVHKLETPEDWWAMVMGTGYRGTVEQLDTANRERVQRENLEFVHERDVRSVEANVVYAIGEKSQ
jgi:SAM-dependent methyltransferase